MLWDSHLHTNFSGDSDASPEIMIEQAVTLELPGICITDHLDYDYPKEPDLFLLQLPEEQVSRWQELSQRRLKQSCLQWLNRCWNHPERSARHSRKHAHIQKGRQRQFHNSQRPALDKHIPF